MTPDALPNMVANERHNLYVALGALGLFITLVIGHRIFFKGWRGGSDLNRLVRDRLRWLSLPLLILLPLWWATTQLDSLFFLSAEIFLTACFMGVVMVLEVVRVVLSRRYSFSEGAVALVLYVVPTLVYIVSVMQIDVLEGATGYALGPFCINGVFNMTEPVPREISRSTFHTHWELKEWGGAQTRTRQDPQQ